MSATLVDGLDSSSGEGKGNRLFEFGYVDAFLLEIRVSPSGTGGGEDVSTSPVGVAASYPRALLCNWAFLRHIGDTLHYKSPMYKGLITAIVDT